jgi:hypothetical protein
VSVQTIAQLHGRAYGAENCGRMSAKAMGNILRTRLNLSTHKSHGVYIIPKSQMGALNHLYHRYNLDAEDIDRVREALGEITRVETGEVGDVQS